MTWLTEIRTRRNSCAPPTAEIVYGFEWSTSTHTHTLAFNQNHAILQHITFECDSKNENDYTHAAQRVELKSTQGGVIIGCHAQVPCKSNEIRFFCECLYFWVRMKMWLGLLLSFTWTIPARNIPPITLLSICVGFCWAVCENKRIIFIVCIYRREKLSEVHAQISWDFLGGKNLFRIFFRFSVKLKSSARTHTEIKDFNIESNFYLNLTNPKFIQFQNF